MKACNTFLLIVAILFFCVHTNAQNQSKAVSIQVRGGMNISNMFESDDHYWASADARIGYNIGMGVDFAVGKGMFIHSGLALTSKGADFDDFSYREGDFSRNKINMNAVYLQLPVYFGYKLDFSRFSRGWNNRLAVSAGPYVAYGVFGKTKIDSRESSVNDIDTFDTLKRAEVGLGMEVSFELQQLLFYMGVDTSLTNVWKKEYVHGDVSVNHTNFYLGIGYVF